jgi:uncharacterized repeat protein (TIGR01451 family)
LSPAWGNAGKSTGELGVSLHQRLATWCIALVVLLLAALSGCHVFSPSQNPAQLYWGLAPNGGIYQTHAKPAGKGYYANFDPYACRVEVRPKTNSTQVGGAQVFLATVYDQQGAARRGRRVEWMIEGPGQIIEVDEGGIYPDRGYKVNEKYAVGYTGYLEHKFDRGNKDPKDDFVINPGQTFCIVTCPVEGETRVTAYVPAIHDMDKNRVTVTNYWLDAQWKIPEPQQARKVATLVTKVFKASDSQPLQGYRVRYKVLDGPPALFANTNGPEADATSDSLGNAVVQLRQTVPQMGITRIGIELVRPPDLRSVTGAGIVVLRGETTVEWVGSGITLNKFGPSVIAINSEFDYQLTVTNTSRSPSDPLTVIDDLPPGLQFVSADPMPVGQEGTRLVWTLLPLPPGGAKVINLKVRANRAGQFNNTAQVLDQDRTKAAESFFQTTATSPSLKVKLTSPPTGYLNGDVAFNIRVENVGDAPASNVIVNSKFDNGLVFYYQGKPSNDNNVAMDKFNLQPREGRDFTLALKAEKVGSLNAKATVTGDGGLFDESSAMVNVIRLALNMNVRGPQARYVSGRFFWYINVENNSDQPVDNVVIRDTLPPEVSLVRVYDNGTQNGNEIVWNLGTMQRSAKRELKVEVEARQVTRKAFNRVVATFGPNLTERSEAEIELRGIPALLMQADQTDRNGTITLGDTTSYSITVNNTGSQKVGKLVVRVKASPELRITRAIGPDGSAGQVQGDTIVFSVMNDLLPTNTFNYQLEIAGVAPGDGRLFIELDSDMTGREPIRDIEQISVVK